MSTTKSIHEAFKPKEEYGRLVYKFNLPLAIELLEAGADPDEKNKFGMTALHIIPMYTLYDWMKEDEIYKKLLDLAISKSSRIIEPIIGAGKFKFYEGITPLHCCVMGDNRVAWKTLLDAGADYVVKCGEKELSAVEFSQIFTQNKQFRKFAAKTADALDAKKAKQAPVDDLSAKRARAWEIDLKQMVNPANVQIRYTLDLPHKSSCMTIIEDRYALVEGGLNPIKVSLIDLQDGTVNWTQSFVSDTFSAPLYADGVIYVGIEDGSAKFSNAALDIITGKALWKTYIANSYSTFSNGSGRVVAGGTMYFFSGAGTLFAYDIKNGKVKFKVKIDKSDPWVTPILWRDHIIVQTTARGKSSLVHLNAATGETIETVALTKGIKQGNQSKTGEPILLGDDLWYVATDNKLHHFDMAAGAEKASYPLPLKITNKVQYDYLTATLAYNGTTFNIQAEVPVFDTDECDVSFDPATGKFTPNPAKLDDKRLLCENGNYRYYEDYNMRPQFAYYIADKTAGEQIHSFSLPGNTSNVSGCVRAVGNGTIVILYPDYDKNEYKLFIAY